jgi:phosphohistidine phosphatase
MEAAAETGPMKRLLLLRHAKSSWDRAEVEDIDRPLAPRGVRAAGAMARFLAAERLTPELVLCSAARRTVDTWSLMAGTLGRRVTVQIEPGLYMAEPRALLTRLRALPDHWSCVMLLGHNPAMQSLARQLVGSGDAAARERLAAKFPTAALAVIDFESGGWPGIGPRQGRLDGFVTPSELE